MMKHRLCSSLSPKERAALLEAKRTAFLEHLARELAAMGPDPKGNTPSCFRQKRGRTAIPVKTTAAPPMAIPTTGESPPELPLSIVGGGLAGASGALSGGGAAVGGAAAPAGSSNWSWIAWPAVASVFWVALAPLSKRATTL